MSSATLRIQGGGTADSIIVDFEDVQPTEGDLLFAAQLQRSRILERTERGVDFQEQQFAGYNSTRPYYYYPNGPVGSTRTKQQLASAKRGVKAFAKAVGRRKSAVTGSGLGIRFDSYRDFKQTYLGRENVDLRGPRAPHMLQELVVKAGSQEGSGRNRSIGIDDLPAKAEGFTVGIYGPAAERASGLNSDDRPKGMPKRQFMGSSDADNRFLETQIAKRVAARMRKKLGGSS